MTVAGDVINNAIGRLILDPLAALARRGGRSQIIMQSKPSPVPVPVRDALVALLRLWSPQQRPAHLPPPRELCCRVEGRSFPWRCLEPLFEVSPAGYYAGIAFNERELLREIKKVLVFGARALVTNDTEDALALGEAVQWWLVFESDSAREEAVAYLEGLTETYGRCRPEGYEHSATPLEIEMKRACISAFKEVFGVTPMRYRRNAIVVSSRCMSKAAVKWTVRARYYRINPRPNYMLGAECFNERFAETPGLAVLGLLCGYSFALEDDPRDRPPLVDLSQPEMTQLMKEHLRKLGMSESGWKYLSKQSPSWILLAMRCSPSLRALVIASNLQLRTAHLLNVEIWNVMSARKDFLLVEPLRKSLKTTVPIRKIRLVPDAAEQAMQHGAERPEALSEIIWQTVMGIGDALSDPLLGEGSPDDAKALREHLLGTRNVQGLMRFSKAWHKASFLRGCRDVGPFPSWSMTSFELNGWTGTRLRDSESLYEEGLAMRHCVAGYALKVARGRSTIFSLRHESGERATLEVSGTGEGWQVVQVVSAGNRLVSESCKAFAQQLAKAFSMSDPAKMVAESSYDEEFSDELPF